MQLQFRQAKFEDISSCVALLANDALGQTREDTSSVLNPRYLAAFEAIDQDPNNQLIVAHNESQLVGMLQLTFIPYLTHTGSWRCLNESVRIHSNYRNKGCGEQLFAYAIKLARNKQCSLL